jgi:hypothetical protein
MLTLSGRSQLFGAAKLADPRSQIVNASRDGVVKLDLGVHLRHSPAFENTQRRHGAMVEASLAKRASP